MDIGNRTKSYQVDDHSWLGSAHGTDSTETITLDVAAFTEGTHYPNGYLLSGQPLAQDPATDLYGPYGGTSDEAVTLTEGGSGLTSFTITFGAQTTGSLDDDATAAQVQTALEALSSIGAGNVVVTGGPLATGPFTLTFAGDLADTNVGAVTTTPTGGTGTVVVAVGTAGGADADADLGVLEGHLFGGVPVPDGALKLGAALLTHGKVRESNLPFPVDANGKADVADRIRYI